eukprot:7390612-Prymnesium_polylepis.1
MPGMLQQQHTCGLKRSNGGKRPDSARNESGRLPGFLANAALLPICKILETRERLGAHLLGGAECWHLVCVNLRWGHHG